MVGAGRVAARTMALARFSASTGSANSVEFFMKMLTDAFSPSNFLASNPAALREVMATGGESLVRGMQNFAADLNRGGGQLSIAQTDYEMFKIGENVATAPGKVVFRNEIIELLQFSPTPDTVCEIPLVISNHDDLRAKVEADPANPALIKTVRGEGYVLAVPPDHVDAHRSPALVEEWNPERCACDQPGRAHLNERR